jgi:hypothetical protein
VCRPPRAQIMLILLLLTFLCLMKTTKNCKTCGESYQPESIARLTERCNSCWLPERCKVCKVVVSEIHLTLWYPKDSIPVVEDEKVSL